MKKQTLIVLANAGIQSITNHTLDAAQAYKVVKFRKSFNAAIDAIAEDEKALLKEAGIEDAPAFNKELEDLRKADRTHEQEEKFKEMTEKVARYNELHAEMLQEEVTLDCKALPYAEWHKLQNENKEMGERKLDLLSGYVEDVLEGILWAAPKEED